MIKLIKGLVWFIPIWILSSCAQVRGVSGGEKDVKAPVVVNTIPQNQSTYFNGKTITIEFDEFVQTGSLLQNLIVSPPLKKNPKISVRGRSVTLTLQEELMENTTYVFQLGEGISDIRENNLLGDFSFVVSTGSVMDSLLVTGNVKDMWEGTPIKGLKALLFDASIDPDSSGLKPLYYSKTDVNGNFKIPFLKEGLYRLEVLDDSNNNMVYDEGEKVAFAAQAVPSQTETEVLPIELNACVPKKKLTFISDLRTDSSGFFSFTWPQWCSLPEVISVESGVSIQQIRDQKSDSVFHWIQGAPLNKDLVVVVKSEDMGLENDSLDILSYSVYQHGFKDLHPVKPKVIGTESFVLHSKYKIENILKDNINLWADSISLNPEIYLVKETNSIIVKFEWKENVAYRLLFQQGSIVATDNNVCDSLEFQIGVTKAAEFGTLSIQFTTAHQPEDIFLLTDNSGETVFKSRIEEMKGIKINFLEPGEYRARVFRDDNKNNLWDAVDYQLKSLPEPLWVFPDKIQIRSNWEVELVW
jgi:Bacterial Ig-like domain